MKFDLHKAYDRVNKQFILHMLESMRVPRKLLKLIAYCLYTPTFSVLMNGVSRGYIHTNRGIRQGDPLSSYLFSMAMEWFSLQMEIAYYQQLIIPIQNIQSIVTHLIYANDLLVVFKANKDAIAKIKDIFNQMEVYAGVKVSKVKNKCDLKYLKAWI